MTMGQRRRHKSVVRKSLVISEKQTAKKHEAAQRYLFQMSGIQWGQHKKKQRTTSRKQRAADRERRNKAPDQPHVRCGNKNKLEEAKTLVNLKRQKPIQERRDANARFEDLLTLANSAELLETQGVCDVDKLMDATHRTANVHTKKDALHDVDKSLDAPCRIGNVQAEKDASSVKGRIRLTHFRHQARLENPLPIQENPASERHEHADLKRVKDTKIDDSVGANQVGGAMHVKNFPGQRNLLEEFFHHQAMSSNSTTKYVRRNQVGFCGPPTPRKVSWTNENPGISVVTERGSKGLLGIRKQASLVEVAKTSTEELQPGVKSPKIIPHAVRMTIDIGDFSDQSDAHLLRKDRTGNMNDPLNENYPNSSWEDGNVPPSCETESSPTQISDAVKGCDPVAHGRGKWKVPSLVEVMTNTVELQPCVEPHKIITEAVRMTADIGDSRDQSDAHLLRKDRTGNMNGPLNENYPNPPREDGNAPPSCETEPSPIQLSDAVKGCDPVVNGRGKWKVPSLVEAMTNTGELQPCVKPHKIITQAVRMRADIGDSRDQSDARVLRKDRTVNMNGTLNELYPNPPQEDGNAPPNCETEPSPVQMSDAVKDRDPVACDRGQRKLPSLAEAAVTNAEELQQCVEPPKIITQAVRMTADIGDSRDQSDAGLLSRDPVARPLVIQKSESLKRGSYPRQKAIQIPGVLKGRDSVKRDYTNRRKKLPLAVQLAELLKEGPSVAREKRLRRTSERRKQRSENPLPRIRKNHINERHDCANPQKFEDTRSDKRVEAQQVQGAVCQELPVVAERGSNGIADIRKEVSMPDPMKVANENSAPCVETDGIVSPPVLVDITVQSDAHQLTKNITAKIDCPFKENNRSTQHRFGHVSLNCEIIPSLILTSDGLPLFPDANTGKRKEAVKDVQDPTRGSKEIQDKEKQASVVEPTKLIPIWKEKRKCPEDEDFAIRKGRPKRPEIVQLPETLKDGVSIARHKRMLRTLERRKERYGGGPCRPTTELHWSPTYQANQWWMWHLTNSQKYEQAHIAKHHESTIYTHYPAQAEQSRVTAREKQLRGDSLMAAAHEKQLKTLEEQRAASKVLQENTNNNKTQRVEPINCEEGVCSPDIAACAEKDSVAVQLNQPVPSAWGEQPVPSPQPMEPTDRNPNMATDVNKETISEVCQDGELQQQSTNEETPFVERKSQLPRLKHEARQRSRKIEKETGKKLLRQKDKAAENKPRRRSSRLLELQQQS